MTTTNPDAVITVKQKQATLVSPQTTLVWLAVEMELLTLENNAMVLQVVDRIVSLLTILMSVSSTILVG